MAGDASAYESLGLDPGADAAAIERAYKKLIKEFHPDREGGDARRAAEINRAYRELRNRPLLVRDPVILHDSLIREEYRSSSFIIPGLYLAGGVCALALATLPLTPELQNWAPAAAQTLGMTPAALGPRIKPVRHDLMDQPLSTSVIDSAIGNARQVASTSDEMGLAEVSGICHDKLRKAPGLTQLDRCAAFDDAVVLLQNRDPWRDRGPFSELAVTARQWSGASALSGDYLAIDSRLDRIKLRVELALAPPVPEPMPQPVVQQVPEPVSADPPAAATSEEPPADQ